MPVETAIHHIQGQILRELLFVEEARFSDLNVEQLTTDHFTFHINQLLNQGYINKSESGKYTLTLKGKEFANRLNAEAIGLEKQGKLAVLILCVDKNTKPYNYLVQQRLHHPYYGYYGLAGGKVAWGEKIEDAAMRILNNQTDLKARLKLIGINHKIDRKESNQIIEDKYYFIFRGEQIKGKLKEKFKGGKNFWLSREEIKELSNKLPGVDIAVQYVDGNSLQFSEIIKKEENY